MQRAERLLKLEFDINYINVVSRRNPNEHAVIRLIISPLATPQEIRNFKESDLEKKGKDFKIRLNSGSRIRISPVDEKTYKILRKVSVKNKDERIFENLDFDKIVEKYSPKETKYNASKLRKAVIEILEDCLFFGNENYVNFLILGKKFNQVRNFLQDFHPLYSGIWDLEDDEVARDFIHSYISLMGISDAKMIANEIGESEERITNLLK